MKLILTRHGETVENRNGILQGQKFGTLSKKGVMQAKKLALRLKNKKIDAVYSSDLARAKNTAKEILAFHPKTPLHLSKNLRETFLGKYAGKKAPAVDWKNRPKKIESKASMMKRVKKVLDKSYKAHPNGVVVFVGHIGINKALERVILNQPLKKIACPPNASITVFEIREDKKHCVHLLNCTNHL